MTVYEVCEDTVMVFVQTDEAFMDGEVFRDDPSLPEWVRKAEPGLYGADGKQLRTLAGTSTSGNRGHKGRKGQVGGSAKSEKTALLDENGKPRSERSLRALKSHVPAKKKSQIWGEKGEALIGEQVGGTRIGGLKPVDVITDLNGRHQGIEVKSLINQKNNKITMRKDAIVRKNNWMKKNKAPMHTVVVDWRDKSSKDPTRYSGHRVYFHAGVGSFRLDSMTRVKSSAHLKQLVGAKYDDVLFGK